MHSKICTNLRISVHMKETPEGPRAPHPTQEHTVSRPHAGRVSLTSSYPRLEWELVGWAIYDHADKDWHSGNDTWVNKAWTRPSAQIRLPSAPKAVARQRSKLLSSFATYFGAVLLENCVRAQPKVIEHFWELQLLWNSSLPTVCWNSGSISLIFWPDYKTQIRILTWLTM